MKGEINITFKTYYFPTTTLITYIARVANPLNGWWKSKEFNNHYDALAWAKARAREQGLT